VQQQRHQRHSHPPLRIRIPNDVCWSVAATHTLSRARSCVCITLFRGVGVCADFYDRFVIIAPPGVRLPYPPNPRDDIRDLCMRLLHLLSGASQRCHASANALRWRVVVLMVQCGGLDGTHSM
jgi:hypothetical protein